MAHPLEETVVHPLFTVDEDSDDDEIKTVTSIHIARKENGKLFFAPRMRAANELTSLEQIQAEFGGGEYVLIGYNNGRISARKTLNLPGKPRPLFDEGIVEPATPVAAAPAPVDPMMAGQGGMMPFFMMMMQQMNQAADRQMQMVIAMMQGGREASSEDKATARAEMQANLERERIASEKQMAMMREMMQLAQSNNKGGDSSQGFTQGVEFMRSFSIMQIEQMKAAAKGEDGPDWGSLIETVGQALQGFGMLKNLGGTGNLPEGVAQAAAEVVQ